MVKLTNEGLLITVEGYGDMENSFRLQKAIIRMIRNASQAIADDTAFDRSDFGNDMYHMTSLLEALMENCDDINVFKLLNDLNESRDKNPEFKTGVFIEKQPPS